MIIFRLVEELLEVSVHLDIVLACSDLEIGDPSELTIDVSLLSSKRGPSRHASASDCIFLKGVKGLLRPVSNDLFLFAALVKVLLFER